MYCCTGFLQPVQSPRIAVLLSSTLAIFPYLVSPASLLKESSIPSCRSWMRTSTCIGPFTDLRKTPLVTGSQLGFVPPIITLWAWQPSRLSTHFIIHFSGPYLINLVREKITGDCIKGLVKIKVYKIHCPLLVCSASHLFIESREVSQAWFALDKLCFPSPCLSCV